LGSKHVAFNKDKYCFYKDHCHDQNCLCYIRYHVASKSTSATDKPLSTSSSWLPLSEADSFSAPWTKAFLQHCNILCAFKHFLYFIQNKLSHFLYFLMLFYICITCVSKSFEPKSFLIMKMDFDTSWWFYWTQLVTNTETVLFHLKHSSSAQLIILQHTLQPSAVQNCSSGTSIPLLFSFIFLYFHYFVVFITGSTRQTIYVYIQHNIEERLRTIAMEKQYVLHICLRMLMRGCPNVWACAYMDACLSSIQHVCAILWCHLWLLWFHHIFWHYLINGTIFGKSNWTQNVCFDFLYNFCLKHFSF
jgi:hypothetical protein